MWQHNAHTENTQAWWELRPRNKMFSPPPPKFPTNTLQAPRPPPSSPGRTPPPPGIFNKKPTPPPPSQRLGLPLPLPRAEKYKYLKRPPSKSKMYLLFFFQEDVNGEKLTVEKMVDFWRRFFSRFGADFFTVYADFSRFIRDINGEKKSRY